MPVDIQDNKVSLAHVLLLLAHCAPASILHKGVWVVTTLLEHKGTSKSVEMLAIAITRRVDPLTDLMEHSTEVIQEVAVDTRKVAMVMYSTWEEVRDKMQKVADMTKEELERMVEEMREEIHKAVRGTKDALTREDEGTDLNAVDNHTASC